MEFALKRYEEREEELRELIEKETNQYKRNALESELNNVENTSSEKFRKAGNPLRKKLWRGGRL